MKLKERLLVLVGIPKDKATNGKLSQNGLVKTLTKIYKGSPIPLSPCDAHKKYVAIKGYDTPITSTRRAITDLTSKGVLIKTNTTKTSMYGGRVHLWKIKI